MKILVVGSGGREHALAWKLAADGARPRLFCAPGNAGTAALADNLPLAAEDTDGIVSWAVRERPDLTVIGPEAPLCAGLTDALRAKGLEVFGPSRDAARIEGSKLFAKDIMLSAGVPTADAEAFDDVGAACAYVRRRGTPVVVKADGLAAGKGVTVCSTPDEAETAIKAMLHEKIFGEAGSRVLIEDCLTGEEVSILALVDGERSVLLASSQDHKRAFQGDRGPNTGGMGAYSPAPAADESYWAEIKERVFDRTLAELSRRNIEYRGVLYAGLMLTRKGLRVLEFNCRFGDPETQAVLPRWEGDVLPAFTACASGRLEESMVRWRDEACACVVIASGGYPGAYVKGHFIHGLDAAARVPQTVVFHAGTTLHKGKTVTSGGRVLGVTGWGKGLRTAVNRAYEAAGLIRFEGSFKRDDIAWRALKNT